MTSYQLSKLNDKEFESLVNDLISELEGTHVERYKPGKDSGIDGRFYKAGGKNTIIQSKHYIGTGFSGLLRKVKLEESKKILNLKADRYILASSVALSPQNKDALIDAINCVSSVKVEVFGADDIEALLDKYPSVLDRHYKLWIGSTAILRNVLHADIVGRSRFKVEQMLEDSEKFVETSSFYKSLDKLNNSRTIIISGEPGAGKTTIAKNLCLYQMGNGYEFVEINESLVEAEKVYVQGRKQIFYFDDFLGSNYLEAIEGKSDSYIVDFIRRVSKSLDKLFILTSRTNILNTGVELSSAFYNGDIRRDEYLIDVDDLTIKDKARILYSHVFRGGATELY